MYKHRTAGEAVAAGKQRSRGSLFFPLLQCEEARSQVSAHLPTLPAATAMKSIGPTS